MDDAAATTSGTYTITGNTTNGQGSALITYGNFTQFSLLPARSRKYSWADWPQSTLNVQGTANGTSYTVGSTLDNGATTFTVGDAANTLNGILGPVQFLNTQANATVTINDQGTTQGSQYDVYSDHVRARRPHLAGSRHADAVVRLRRQYRHRPQHTPGATLNTGAGADTVDVLTVAAGTTPFTINGQGGTNGLTVDDRSNSNTNQAYLVADGQIGGPSPNQPIMYSNFANATLDTSTGSGAAIQVKNRLSSWARP